MTKDLSFDAELIGAINAKKELLDGVKQRVLRINTCIEDIRLTLLTICDAKTDYDEELPLEARKIMQDVRIFAARVADKAASDVINLPL